MLEELRQQQELLRDTHQAQMSQTQLQVDMLREFRKLERQRFQSLNSMQAGEGYSHHHSACTSDHVDEKVRAEVANLMEVRSRIAAYLS